MPNPDNIVNHKFPKGKSGNPSGHPKGVKNRSTILRKWIEVNAKVTNPITKQEEAGTVEDLIAIALLTKAIKGDVQAIKEINDTLYGKLLESSKIDASINVEYSKLSRKERRERIELLRQKLLKK
jgi:hypothetical protein